MEPIHRLSNLCHLFSCMTWKNTKKLWFLLGFFFSFYDIRHLEMIFSWHFEPFLQLFKEIINCLNFVQYVYCHYNKGKWSTNFEGSSFILSKCSIKDVIIVKFMMFCTLKPAVSTLNVTDILEGYAHRICKLKYVITLF